VDEPEAQPRPIAEEARRLRASWLDPPPDAPYPSRRIGWAAVGIAVGAVMLLAVRLMPVLSDVDPGDPGWGDIMVFVSPFFAIAAAFVVGLVLVVVSAKQLVGLTAGRAGRATMIGLIGGPLVYLAVLLVSASAIGTAAGFAGAIGSAAGIDSAFTVDGALSSPVLAFMTFVLPVICGIVVTLFAAHPRHPPRAAWPMAGR
jgi:hypothetical protein